VEPEDAQAEIFAFMNGYYNTQRLHYLATRSAFGQSPAGTYAIRCLDEATVLKHLFLRLWFAGDARDR
jgi:hypothetical protein